MQNRGLQRVSILKRPCHRSNNYSILLCIYIWRNTFSECNMHSSSLGTAVEVIIGQMLLHSGHINHWKFYNESIFLDKCLSINRSPHFPLLYPSWPFLLVMSGAYENECINSTFLVTANPIDSGPLTTCSDRAVYSNPNYMLRLSCILQSPFWLKWVNWLERGLASNAKCLLQGNSRPTN